MTPRDAFEVLVRTLGLWLVVQGGWEIFQILFFSITGKYGPNLDGVPGQFVVGLARTVFGLALMLRADLVGRFVYRENNSSRSGEPET